MADILKDFDFLEVFLAEILMFSENIKKHAVYVENVLKKLQENKGCSILKRANMIQLKIVIWDT